MSGCKPQLLRQKQPGKTGGWGAGAPAPQIHLLPPRAPGWQGNPSSFAIWLERARLGWELNKAGKRQRAEQGALSHPSQAAQAPGRSEALTSSLGFFSVRSHGVASARARHLWQPAAGSSPRPCHAHPHLFKRGDNFLLLPRVSQAQSAFIKPGTGYSSTASPSCAPAHTLLWV